MSIDMYLESARSQATSLSSISAQCVQQNIELIKVLENFVAEEELKGHAYDSAKAHITSTVIPLIQGIVLYQESLAEECQKFVSQYTSDVDSKSWRQVDLEEKIREADQKISNLRQLMETKSDDKISAFLNLSLSIAVLEGAKQKLQKILISLLTFNAVSPTIFLNSERYLLAVQNGFAQAAQSWDAASGTYLPPSNGADLSWKQTISLGWQKRQAVLNKVKNPKVETLEEKLSKMSRAELEEEYGSVIQSYKRFLTMGQGDNVTATMDYEDVKLIWKRYNEVKNDHLGLLPSELAKVDPKFRKRIDAMDQEALEEAYPELKTLISMAHVNPYAQLFKSETERANYDYLLDRYFLLDSQKMLSWRDPAFQTKYDYYIIEEGIDPFTGKPATQEEINRAKDIKKVRTVTESFQLASTLYTSYVGYNQYYNKPYTTFSDVFSKVKGKVPFFNRKPVIPEVNPKVDTNVKTITEPAKTYDRERILRNIEESKLARESSGFKDFATRERYLEKVFDKLTPEERELIFNISKNAPKVEYRPGKTSKSVLSIPKEDRPIVEKVYSSEYIKAHKQQFENGAARFQKFQPSENWNGGIVGGDDGTSFWLSKEHADIIEKVANGDNRLYEIILGLDEGYLEDGPLYRLDVTPEVVAEKGISIPSGREAGANDWWRPTGRTFPGDIPEGVMKDISTKRGEHTWNIVN
ncbi:MULTISPECIES: hypothetical protein [Streptococcus]|uniref:hypothetical protein n=1 Tax=Streptococcus TaxID=1301 RepID=UPI00066D7B87|nr:MULTISPECIES: hypothetical protein [Streptococcus]MCP9034901.1 hypothetical protein [Streptococcus sp. CF8_Ac1-9]MCP9043544.1 hypothetical protein [Streptococcus sp. CF8_Ac1-11]MCR4485895.1 hypothetical protein [Streptococcus parasanguinis]MDU3001645.1 hypothetical protein [Streptococcus parasanguinis]